MTEQFEGLEYPISKNRLETLVDGIFAVTSAVICFFNPPISLLACIALPAGTYQPGRMPSR